MKKAAVIIAPGFEEGEAINVIDILRRAGVDCESVSLQGKQVTATKRDLTSVIKHMIICCKFVAGN